MIRNWKFWLGLAISVVALYFTFRGIHFDEFVTTLLHAQIVWFVPATVILLITLVVRAWRWSSLMGGTPLSVTFHALNIGYMLNMILPFRLGEIGRAYVIGERTSVRMTRALTAVIVERMLDLGALVLLFALVAQIIPIPAEFSSAALISAVLLTVLVVVFAAMVWQSRRVERMLDAVASGIPQLRASQLTDRFRDLVDGFQIIRTPSKFVTNVLLTAAIWGLLLIVAYLTMMAFMPAQLDKAGSVLVLSNLGGALPSAPGGLGVVQFFAKQSLVVPFHVAEGLAVAFAFVWSLYQEFLLIVLGIFGLLRVGMTFTSVTASSRQPEPVSQQPVGVK